MPAPAEEHRPSPLPAGADDHRGRWCVSVQNNRQGHMAGWLLTWLTMGWGSGQSWARCSKCWGVKLDTPIALTLQHPHMRCWGSLDVFDHDGASDNMAGSASCPLAM